MLKVSNLTIVTLKGKVLVKDFSFVLNSKDKIALIGEEGNGKSTILKILAGIDVSSYVMHTGTVETDNSIVGYLPQSLSSDELQLTAQQYFSQQENYELYSRYSSIKKLFSSLKLNIDLLDQQRPLRTFSGGERMKIALCRLLLYSADILLLDEPTNDLDLETLIWLEDFISQCSLPVIFISHDDTLLENCSNGILHLEQLKRKQESVLTYSGLNYADYLKQRNLTISKTNMMAAKEKTQLNKQLEKYRQIYQKVDHQQKTISRQDPHGGYLLKKKMHAVKSLEKRLDEKASNLTQKIEPEEAISIYFEPVTINPNKIVLDFKLNELKIDDSVLSKNIELLVLGKDKIAITGKNGAGKSTLLKAIMTELNNKTDINAGYLPQNYGEMMDYSITPVQFLENDRTKEETSRIRSYLGSLKFTAEEMLRPIENLSDGQKCKVLMLKLVLSKCDVVLLDEPTRNLSPLSNPQIRQMFIDYGGAVIVVTHDRKFIDEVCNKLYSLTDEGLLLIKQN